MGSTKETPMGDSHVPKRLRWAVQQLNIAPDDEILEIGPGPGASVSLICEQLATGRITAIHRSAIAIQRAAKRNASCVASGKAVLQQLDLADIDLVRRALAGRRFDKVFAVNVNLFWVRPADAELQPSRTCYVPAAPYTWCMRHPVRSRPTGPPRRSVRP
jgi:hypothetical protein